MDRQPLHTLTAMTGQTAPNTRTVVVGFVEMPWRVLILGLTGLATGFPAAAILWFITGPWSLFFLAAWVAVWMWLFHGRTRKGLRIHNYVQLLNRRAANLNEFLYGDAIVTVPRRDWVLVQPGSLPNPAKVKAPNEILADERTKSDAVFDLFNPTTTK